MSKPEGKEETRKQKFADHPHLWTIVLSTVAIVVSGLSYFESHRTRVMNEELNRPIVRVTAIDVGLPALGPTAERAERFTNTYTLHVHNNGKVLAGSVMVSYKAQLEDLRVGEGLLRFSDLTGATISDTNIGDLAPDEDYGVTFWASVLREPPTIPVGDHRVSVVSLYVKGNVSYVNPIDSRPLTQTFCFSDPGSQGHFRRCSHDDEPKKGAQ